MFPRRVYFVRQTPNQYLCLLPTSQPSTTAYCGTKARVSILTLYLLWKRVLTVKTSQVCLPSNLIVLILVQLIAVMLGRIRSMFLVQLPTQRDNLQ